MNTKLSIIIPQYNEEKRTISGLLHSIDNQIGIDFSRIEVIIVNDCSDTLLPSSFLRSFKNIKIDYIKKRINEGPGLARQTGLDRVKDGYVMFCDADDILHSVGVIGLIFKIIDEKNPSIITSNWLEECRMSDNKLLFLPHPADTTWMHGKAYSKNFLDKYNIRFDKELRIHEDSYFNALAFEFSESTEYADQITYVWCWNNGSITRRNEGSYVYDSFSVFIDALDKAIEALSENLSSERVARRVMQAVLYSFFSLQNDVWLKKEARVHNAEAELRLKRFIEKYSVYYDCINRKDFVQIYNSERVRVMGTGYIERELYCDFIKRIKELGLLVPKLNESQRLGKGELNE